MKNPLLILVLSLLTSYSIGQTTKRVSKNNFHSLPDSAKQKQIQVLEENKQFENLKGKLPVPVDSQICLDFNEDPIYNLHGCAGSNRCVTFVCRQNTNVKAIASCTVDLVTYIGDSQAIIFRSGKYFIVYSNLKNITVKKCDKLAAGDVIGVIDEIRDDNTELEVFLSDDQNKYLIPSKWFKLPSTAIVQTDNKN